MKEIGFDNEKYLKLQSESIKKRIAKFGGKLYLEFGGKLFDDYHASRVLPGFQPDSKMRMLQTLGDSVEIVISISAVDIEKNKQRSDIGIPYEDDVLRLMDVFSGLGLYVGSVVITQYSGEASADAFRSKLNSLHVKNYLHYYIDDYPSDVSRIVSDEGYGRNDYIETSRSLIVMTAPGPGSGKMAACLSQLYHDHKRGIRAGYAKFETFPIWNLPLSHPVNIAYEAATADLNDVNMIDPYHLENYGTMAVNYNRDVEIFPVLSTMFKLIQGDCPYKSPTDMGVNMVGCCITDDAVVQEAARAEILRRYYTAEVERVRKGGDGAVSAKLKLLMNKAGITPELSPTIRAALSKETETGAPAGALCLHDGRVITGKTSELLGAASSLLLNSLKALGDIPDEKNLISPQILEPVCKLKTQHLGAKNPRLHSDEVLMSLCICAVSDPVADAATRQLENLRGCDAHFSVIISDVDEQLYKSLGMNVTCQPKYESNKLYHK